MSTTHEISRNLGGDRLGSGSKMEVTMHNYNRSNHDLSYAWRSTMNVGTLVPFMKLVEENGDGFEINLSTLVKTVPTIGPLFGAYKLQLDVFECPMRLYNGILHNNMTKIGMNMSQVKFPKMTLTTKINNPADTIEDYTNSQINSSSLLKYLGISGIGAYKGTYQEDNTVEIERKANAMGLLAYWDIYKNYYANKQEEIGVVISKISESAQGQLTNLRIYNPNNQTSHAVRTVQLGERKLTEDQEVYSFRGDSYQEIPSDTRAVIIEPEKYITIGVSGAIRNGRIELLLEDGEEDEIVDLETVFPMAGVTSSGNILTGYAASSYIGRQILAIGYNSVKTTEATTKLENFNLDRIDNARIQILKKTGLNTELNVNTDINTMPYNASLAQDSDGYILSKYRQAGLGIKTYQSDLLQNWLSTEWIDGENGINKITAIDTSSGSFEIDALILANKVYNMLNRIAISGGTFEDWQEAVFTANVNRRAETPIYRGGMACEIVFDEVVSTSATEDQPLGSLAGHAITPDKGKRGGHIEIKCDEPSLIMGIVSITPRIDYSQGNDWDVFELDTMDDLHKPALDGIGFEDLLQERAAWFGTYYDLNSASWVKLAMGKTPAWMNYMTNINKTYGDFASEECMFMTLNRRYELDQDNYAGIGDLTTYIDPAKYNYVFAESSLEAQNFWVQIGVEVTARRVMSAKILPNL